MFLGRFAHTIDGKGRVSIPAGFRVEMQRRSDRAPILTNAHECLYLYPYEEWVAFVAMLDRAASLNLDYHAYRRFVLSGASECPIDAQGRLLIPQPLREHADLKRDVIIAGVGEHIELWDKVRFGIDFSKTLARLPEISSGLGKLGT